MINIREAQADDLSEILNLYSLMFGDGVFDEEAETRKIWNHIITDSNYHVIVADEDGQIVSTCTCVIVPNVTYDRRPYAIVENIVTASEFRAQGLATACLEEAKSIAQAANCFRILLTTGSRLDSTHKFYQKLGYNKTELTAFSQWL